MRDRAHKAADMSLNTTGITGSIGRPSAIAIANKELYLCTTTAISADNGTSLGVKVIVEYDLIKFILRLVFNIDYSQDTLIYHY